MGWSELIEMRLIEKPIFTINHDWLIIYEWKRNKIFTIKYGVELTLGVKKGWPSTMTLIKNCKYFFSFLKILNIFFLQIKETWIEISRKFCEEHGLAPIPYKAFSSRWKNIKFYSKKRASLGVGERKSKYLVKIEDSPDLNE